MLKQGFPLKKWILLNSTGWFAGAVLVIFFSSLLHSAGIENMQFYLSLAIGLGMSLAQAIVLVRYNIKPARWVIATVLGFFIPFALGDASRHLDIFYLESYYIPVCVGAGSILAALLQGKLHPLLKNPVWVLVTFVAWSCAGLIVFAVEFTKYITQNNLVAFFINLTAIVSGGLIIGIITGLYLRNKLLEPVQN